MEMGGRRKGRGLRIGKEGRRQGQRKGRVRHRSDKKIKRRKDEIDEKVFKCTPR